MNKENAHKNWAAGSFTVTTTDGALEIAGWVNGLFALDFRVFGVSDPDDLEEGWALTHLPTGGIIAALIAPLWKACDLAERISELGDWDFTDLQNAKGFRKRMVEMRDENTRVVLLSPPIEFSPTFLEYNGGGA